MKKVIKFSEFSLGLIFGVLGSASSHSIGTLSENFFSLPTVTFVTLSPSGKYASAIRHTNEKDSLVLIDTKTSKEEKIIDLGEISEKNMWVKGVKWIDDQYLSLRISEANTGVEDLLNTKLVRRNIILDLKANDKYTMVLSVRTKGTIISALPSDPGAFLYARSGRTSRVYKLRASELAPYKSTLKKIDPIDGGQFKSSNIVKSLKGYALGWFLDNDLELQSVLNINSNAEIVLTRFLDEDTTEELMNWGGNDSKDVKGDKNKDNISIKPRLIPMAMGENSDVYYCLDFNEEDERKVYKVNYSTKKEELIYETSAFKITDLVLTDERKLIGVQVLKNGVFEYEYINNTNKDISEDQKNSNPELISRYNYGNDLSLAYRESHNTPGEYLMFSGDTSKILVRAYPDSLYSVRSSLVRGSLDVEGLKIPYLLTLPLSGTESKPLIVMPHGGPIGIFDDQYFDSRTQYFSEAGFAILRVNFRGSSGYSQKLHDAGKKQFDKLILRDIELVTRNVLKRSDLDSKAVCIVGASYGGYASIMLSSMYPDLFKCSVSISAPSDLNLFLMASSLSDGGRSWWKEVIGDPDTEYDALKNSSPIYRVSDIKNPLFIAHGEKDKIVDVEHAYRLKLMLEKYNKSFQWYLDPDSGHSFYGEDARSVLFGKILYFLNMNIGEPRE